MNKTQQILWVLLTPVAAFAADYYVATHGSNAANGSWSTPWATLQYGLDQVASGDTVFARAGVYQERVVFNQSGVTLAAASNEVAIIDGEAFSVGAGWDPLVDLNGQSNLRVDGLEIRSLKTSVQNHVPVGLLVRGGSKNIQLANLIIHDIETTYTGSEGGDAHGLAVYGDTSSSISNLLIDAVEIYNCKLGSSESMVLNGNVEYFTVQNCIVHDNNNIGIDFIGHEGTCSDPSKDQARDGLCVGNTVYNIKTIGNPAYGSDRSSDGIYVDGGTRIVIERNVVHDSDIGLEIASEWSGKTTSYITLRNNLVYSNYTGGIFVGGYDEDRGSSEYCTIIGNTTYHNDTGKEYNGEIYLQMYVKHCVFENNLIVPLANDGGDAVFIGGAGDTPVDTHFNHNFYFSSVSNSDNHLWTLGGSEHYSFSEWQGVGEDADSLCGVDPLFASPASGDFSLGLGSPAIDQGTNRSDCGTFDLADHPRIHNGAVDIGGYEFFPYTVQGTPHAWLNFYGITNDYDAAELGDVDLDGMSAWQEYQAGTDPADSSSFFRIIELRSDGQLTWLGGTNEMNAPFQVWSSTNLLFGAWSLATNFSRTLGDHGTNRWAGSTAASPQFYRITVLEE